MKTVRWFIFLLATTAAFAQCTADRPELTKTLLDAKVIDLDRVLAHCSHTCDLRFGGDAYHVLDVRELVKNVSDPRGVNQIVILDPAWKVAKTIPYIDERPLFCRYDQVFILGKMRIPDSIGGPGNVIVFRGPDLDVEFRNVEWASLPTLRESKK
jgi:hypothetical protein